MDKGEQFSQILKNLIDNKIKGGEEVEAIVKKFLQGKDLENIKLLISSIKLKFTLSPQVQNRKSGLWGLASVSIALMKDGNDFSKDIILPITQLSTDPDSKIRFHSCEALYNVIKSFKGVALAQFKGLVVF